MKEIDIVIPFWGDPDLLYKAVQSVRDQTQGGWALTVVDDCYPDPSVAVYFERLNDERVVYVRNERNVGITENFREAVRRSRAEHLVILGCDDMLLPNYLELIRRTLAAVPDADVVQPGVHVIDERGELVLPLVDRIKQRVLAPRGKDICVMTGQAMATSLMWGDWLYWPSLTFRRETLLRIDFRDDLPVIQDLALLMDVAFDGGTLAYNPVPGFLYRRHSESASQKALLDGERFRGERRYLALARKLAVQKGWRATARVARLRLMSRLHGATVLPAVLAHRGEGGLPSTLAHVFAF